jgi:hypothetical protein
MNIAHHKAAKPEKEENMFGAIVLRDIPKEEVRIDLYRRPIQGGFRGFRMVPPGLHYVSVKVRQHYIGFWCWVKPNQVLVRVFDLENGFEEDAPDVAAHYVELAVGGAMDGALLPYAHQKFGPWFGLILHINMEDFPPTIHDNEVSRIGTTRFDTVLKDTHGGNPRSFLAEFQFAFVRWLVSLDTDVEDEAAFVRWRHLLLSTYHAGDYRIAELGELFPKLVDTLFRQFALLSDEWFEPDSFLTKEAGYLVEDMMDSGIPEIAEKGQTFADYLKQRISNA